MLSERYRIMETLHTTTLTTLECCQCGMPVGLVKTWVEHARAIGGFEQKFYCPYCKNQQGWGASKNKKELKRLKKQVADYKAQRDHALTESQHFRKSRDGMKGALVRQKNRIKNGVCPCCNRHFANLERHMKSQHPDC